MEAIFTLRHGQAEDIDPNNSKSDFDRKLTQEGKERTEKLSLLFDKLNEEVNLVLTSPYIRAKETAEIFVSKIEPKPELKIVDFLSCGASCKDIAKGLLPYLSLKKVVIVGHGPDLEMFLGKLIRAEKIKLKKGAIAKVILDNSIELIGELEWLVTSKIVKKLKTKSKDNDKAASLKERT